MIFKKVFKNDLLLPVGRAFRLAPEMIQNAGYWGVKKNSSGFHLGFFSAPAWVFGSFFQEKNWKLFRLDCEIIVQLEPNGSLLDKTEDRGGLSDIIDLFKWCSDCERESRQPDAVSNSEGQTQLVWVCCDPHCPSRLC